MCDERGSLPAARSPRRAVRNIALVCAAVIALVTSLGPTDVASATSATKTSSAASATSASPPSQPSTASGTFAGSVGSGLDAGMTNTCAVTSNGQARCWGYNGLGQTTVPADLGPVSAISAGNGLSCAIRVDGTPRCWGYVDAVPADPVTSLAVGSFHACAIKLDGIAECWGRPASGNEIIVPPDLGPVIALAAGMAHTCAVKIDGTPVCWGNGASGDTTIPGDVSSVRAITAGQDFTCAIRTDGTPRCWGQWTEGQTTLPPGLGTVTAITAGNWHACAVKTDGTTACWGLNTSGQSTVPGDLGTVTSITGGGRFTCAVKSNGSPTCWGINTYGQTTIPADLGSLGRLAMDGGYRTQCGIRRDGNPACWGLELQDAPPAGTVTSIATGYHKACAIRTDGVPTCWGWGSGVYALPPVPAGLTATAISISMSETYPYACALRTDSIVQCWGGIFAAAFPFGTQTVRSLSPTAGPVCAVLTSGLPSCIGGGSVATIPPGTGTVRSIESYGSSSACAIKTDSTVVCWGSPVTPQPPAGLGTVTALNMGAASCAIKTDGTPACWGTASLVAAMPADIGTISLISSSTHNTCAVKSSGLPVCWGDGIYTSYNANDPFTQGLQATQLQLNRPFLGSFATHSLGDSFTGVGMPPWMTITPEGGWYGTPPSYGTYDFDVQVWMGSTLAATRHLQVEVAIFVTATSDATDANPSDGCATSAGPCTLRAAVQQANTNAGADTIYVPAGTYTLTIGGTGEDAAASGDLDVTGSTLIRGDNSFGAITIDGNHLDRVFHVHPTGALELALVTVANGAPPANEKGGGILVAGGQAATYLSTISANTSTGVGGGVHVTSGGSFAAYDGSIITNNDAAIGGGLAGDSGSTINIAMSTIEQNDAAHGGGIASAGVVTFIDSTMRGNEATGHGGGFWTGGDTSISRSTVAENYAGGFAGGVGSLGTADIAESTISDNAAQHGGGIAVAGTATIRRSSIANNGASAYATEVFNVGNLTIDTSSIDAKLGTAATAIYNAGSTWGFTATLTLTNDTIVSTSRTRAITNDIGAGPLTLTNTIVQANPPPANPSAVVSACGGVVTSGGYNLISDLSCSFAQPSDAQGIPTLTGALADNGGPTLSHLPGSPAIGTGNPACSGTDQLGFV